MQDSHVLRVRGNQLILSCRFEDRGVPLAIGAQWDKSRRRWEMPLTSRAAAAIYASLDYVQVTEEAERAIDQQIAHEDRLLSIKAKAKQDQPTKLRVPGLKLRPYNYQKWGIVFAVNNGRGVLVADEMGLGKCAVGKSFVNTPRGTTTIEGIFSQYCRMPFRRDQSGEWYDLSRFDVRLLSMVDGNLGWQKARSIYREEVDATFAVLLQDGTKLDVGGRHGFFTTSGWKKADDLREGDWVRVAAHLEVPEPVDVDGKVAEFLSWQISEGSEGRTNYLCITQDCEDVLSRLWSVFKGFSFQSTEVSGVKRPQNKVPYLYVCSGDYKRWLLEEFPDYVWGARSGCKVIPHRIQNSQCESARVFLRAFWDAKGSCNKDNIEISSKSRKVVEGLHYMHRRFGILGVIRPVERTTSRGVEQYWRITISGKFVRRFAEQVGFSCSDKASRLAALCAKRCNTNVGLSVPCRGLLQELVATGLSYRMLGLDSRVYTHPSVELQNPSRGMVGRVIQYIDWYLREGITRTRNPRWLKRRAATIRAFEGCRERIKEIRDELAMLSSEDFFWLSVKSVVLSKSREWVYDFEMDGEPNYLLDMCVTHNSMQGIATALFMKERSGISSCLVVTPASLKWNWPLEIQKFTEEPFVVIDGAPAKRIMQWNGQVGCRIEPNGKAIYYTLSTDNPFFYVVNFELVMEDLFGGREYKIRPGDSEKTIARKTAMAEKAIARSNQLASVRQRIWDMIIVDEAHALKTHRSKRTRNLKELQARFRMALTGTPMDGRLEELHSVIDWVVPGLLGGKTRFLQKHAEFDYWGRVKRYKNIEVVRDAIAPFYIRRLKKDVLAELPDKVYENRYVVLSPAERRVYDKMKKQEHPITEYEEAIVRVIRCKQFCDAPELVDIDMKQRSKMELFLGILDELVVQGGQKVVIFSQYAAMCEIIRRELDTLGLRYLYIWSDTDKQDRAAMQQQFNTDPKIDAMLGTDAMSLGLNFTGSSYVINYDDAWSPSVMQQREDRCHRLGQKDSVTVVNFICRDTIEEHIRDVLSNKATISANTLGDDVDQIVLKRLSPQEMLNLL